jgi:hypothetical protein
MTPNLYECANASYKGSLNGLPLHLCSETTGGRQRPLLCWPSWDYKGASDGAVARFKVIARLTSHWARADGLRATRPLISVFVTRGLEASAWQTRLLPGSSHRFIHIIDSQVILQALVIGRPMWHTGYMQVELTTQLSRHVAS